MNTLIPAHLNFELLILCHYMNMTAKRQVIQINNVDQWCLDRVVLPGEDVLFEAPQGAELEIFSGGIATLPAERIPCLRLQARQPQALTA
jgi:hypothetical protein